MISLKTRHIGIVVALILLLLSIVGMMILKSELEYHSSTTNELYFSIFRILFIGVLFFFAADWLFKKWKEYQQLKNEKAKAELVNLKNQISPHFFFNTLNNLYGLIKKDADKAREYVLKLSDLMRHSIYSSDSDNVAINEEISFLENFIALHKIRYYGTVDISFEKEIETECIKIYPLLLIVLVENAFKHGVENQTENAFVHLTIRTTIEKLVFTIANNLDSNAIDSTNGVGLMNLRKRLILLYPEKHSLVITTEKEVFHAVLELEL